ncbi:MAG TPA: hypothetical protein VIJ36_18970, partial [Thermoanaerobaculia bacterium]
MPYAHGSQLVLALVLLGMLRGSDAADESVESGGSPDDAARLVARIQSGDPAAEAELVARFSRGLLLMLRRLAQNPALA